MSIENNLREEILKLISQSDIVTGFFNGNEFRSDNNKTYSVNDLILTTSNIGSCFIVWWQEKQKYLLVASTNRQIIRNQILQQKRNRYVPPVKKEILSSIKVLFSVLEDDELKFYVGGDRATPTYLFSISIAENVLFEFSRIKAYIDNYGIGENDFKVSVWYSLAVLLPGDEVVFDNKAFTWVNGVVTTLLDVQGNDYNANYMGDARLLYTPQNIDDTSIGSTTNFPSSPPACNSSIIENTFTILPTEEFTTSSIVRTTILDYVIGFNNDDVNPGAICRQSDEQQEWVVNYSSESLLLNNSTLETINTTFIQDYDSYITATVEPDADNPGYFVVTDTQRTSGTKSTNISFTDFSYITNSTLTDGADPSNSIYDGTAIVDLDNIYFFYGKNASLKQKLNWQLNFTNNSDNNGDFDGYISNTIVVNEDKIYLELANTDIELYQKTSIYLCYNNAINIAINNTFSVNVNSAEDLADLLNEQVLFGRRINSTSVMIANAVITDVDEVSGGVYNLDFSITAGSTLPYASFVVDNSSYVTIISSNESIQQIFLRPADNVLEFNTDVVEFDSFQYIISTANPYSYYNLPNNYNLTNDISYKDVFSGDNNKFNFTGYQFIEDTHRTNLVKNKFFITERNNSIKTTDSDIYTEQWTVGSDGKINKTKLIKSKVLSLQNENCYIHSVQYYQSK